ncbi:MAG: hypothetical protein ACOH17_04350 [Cellulomonas sp.]
MSEQLVAVVLAGGLGILGTVAGVAMSTWLGRSTERERRVAQDARRWQTDRRGVYSAFLGLSESLLYDIDQVSHYLSYDGTQDVPEENRRRTAEQLEDYFIRWQDDLQPALGEVQLLASSRVADLADRVSAALMEITGGVEMGDSYTNFSPEFFRARDLVGVLRNAMRNELGLDDPLDLGPRREANWPWLTPPRSGAARHPSRGD